MKPRCPWTLATPDWHSRCRLVAGHNGPHVARLDRYHPYDKMTWYAGDDREYLSDRTRLYAWKPRQRKGRHE